TARHGGFNNQNAALWSRLNGEPLSAYRAAQRSVGDEFDLIFLSIDGDAFDPFIERRQLPAIDQHATRRDGDDMISEFDPCRIQRILSRITAPTVVLELDDAAGTQRARGGR